MAASKRTPKRGTPAARRTAKATKLGFEGDVAAMKASTRAFGLVQNEAGKWVRPSLDFVKSQMNANGWMGVIPGSQTARNPAGTVQTGTTPVNIGGMRVMVGPDGLDFTGMRSDAAKQNPGGSYLDPSGKYKAAGVNAKGGHDKPIQDAINRRTRGKGKGPLKGKGKGRGKGKGGGGAGAERPKAAEQRKPYAEADTTTTSMLRAQGKAYAASREGYGTSRRGSESAPEHTEEEEKKGGGRRRRRRPNHRRRLHRPNKGRAGKGKGK